MPCHQTKPSYIEQIKRGFSFSDSRVSPRNKRNPSAMVNNNNTQYNHYSNNVSSHNNITRHHNQHCISHTKILPATANVVTPTKVDWVFEQVEAPTNYALMARRGKSEKKVELVQRNLGSGYASHWVCTMESSSPPRTEEENKLEKSHRKSAKVQQQPQKQEQQPIRKVEAILSQSPPHNNNKSTVTAIRSRTTTTESCISLPQKPTQSSQMPQTRNISHQEVQSKLYLDMFSALVGEKELRRIEKQFHQSRRSQRVSIPISDLLNL